MVDRYVKVTNLDGVFRAEALAAIQNRWLGARLANDARFGTAMLLLGVGIVGGLAIVISVGRYRATFSAPVSQLVLTSDIGALEKSADGNSRMIATVQVPSAVAMHMYFGQTAVLEGVAQRWDGMVKNIDCTANDRAVDKPTMCNVKTVFDRVPNALDETAVTRESIVWPTRSYAQILFRRGSSSDGPK